MEQFKLLDLKETFLSNNAPLVITFKAIRIAGSYTPWAVLNRQLIHDFSILRDKSAHFWKKDCFECLSPHLTVA